MGVLGRRRNPFLDSKFNFTSFDIEFESFEEYLKITNELIERQLKLKIEEYQSYGEAAEHIFDNWNHFVRVKTLRLYYSSIIISLYSFLEQSMYQLSKIANSNLSSLKIEDINGNGVKKYKTYLEKVISINFSSMEDEWNEIIKYQNLRNLFVHQSNTVITKINNKKRINSIKGINGLKIKEFEDFFYIEFENDESIKSFIKVIKKFLTKIYYIDFEEILKHIK